MVIIYIMLLFVSSLVTRCSAAAHSTACRGNTGTVANSFCGGGGHGSPTCCTAEDDLKLHQLFLDKLLLTNSSVHRERECSSAALKAKICAVCLAPAPASEPFSNTTASITNNSSLPLNCAAAAPSSVSIHDLTSPSTETPTPDQWLLADDDNKASTTPKWLIALISVIGTLLGGFVVYKVFKPRLEVECCYDCCKDIHCSVC